MLIGRDATLTADAEAPDTPVCEVAPVARECKRVDDDRDGGESEGEDELRRLINLGVGCDEVADGSCCGGLGG